MAHLVQPSDRCPNRVHRCSWRGTLHPHLGHQTRVARECDDQDRTTTNSPDPGWSNGSNPLAQCNGIGKLFPGNPPPTMTKGQRYWKGLRSAMSSGAPRRNIRMEMGNTLPEQATLPEQVQTCLICCTIVF